MRIEIEAARPVRADVDRGAEAGVSQGAAQTEVDDAGRRGKRKPGSREPYADVRILCQSRRQRPVRDRRSVDVDIHALDASVSGRDRVEAPNLGRTIDAERFDADGDAEGIGGSGDDVGVGARSVRAAYAAQNCKQDCTRGCGAASARPPVIGPRPQGPPRAKVACN